MKLRDYQAGAVAAALAAFEAGERSTLVVLPTGTGKTHCFAELARLFAERKSKTLVLAHRGELLEQAAATLAAFGLRVAVEKAEQRAHPHSLFDEAVVASIQTMQGRRLELWPRDAFGLVVCDEAHHYLAPSFKRVIDHFSGAKVYGTTATPERGDGDKLGSVFPHLAYEYPMADAVRDGHLAPLRIERPQTAVDLSKIRTTCGDLNQGDLEDEISKHIEELVNSAKERIGDRPTLVFTPDVGSAEAFADGLRQVGVTARHVSGVSRDRHDVVRAFKAGEFQVLCNCVLLTEGFDAPATAAIVLARPTKSGVLYRQMVGRGTRTHPGKFDCKIIDFAWNSGEHDLVSPLELFGTTATDVEVLEIADELIRDERQPDPLKAIDEAEEIHRERVAFRVRVRERESSYRFTSFDPFAIGGALGVARRRTQGGQPLLDSQRRRLDRYKIGYEGLTRGYAGRLLSTLDRRDGRGLASHRQVSYLMTLGMDASQAAPLKKRNASEEIDRLKDSGRSVGVAS